MTSRQILALDKSLYNARSTLNGRTWKFANFVTRFQRYFPELANLDNTQLRDCLKIVSIQNDINKLLRKRGMSIKSRNFYSEFVVVEDSGKKVQHIRSKVQRLTAYANDLNQGLFAYSGRYSAKLDATEVESIANESSVRVARISY